MLISFTFYIILILKLNLNNAEVDDTADSDKLESSIVRNWAETLGNELWTLGRTVTQLEELRKSYKQSNASVLPTDGRSIVNTIVSKMNQMVEKKMNAVMRIKQAVEKNEVETVLEDNFTYSSSKYSMVDATASTNFTDHTSYLEKVEEKIALYRNMSLSENVHFYDVPVNTNHSSVHIPTNTYDNSVKVRSVIQWSEQLDKTFRDNYNSDPSLIWQYFGSTTGMFRHFPAFHWKLNPDIYDCRSRIWYVQASTCSKEVVILVDNSGSMFGMKNTILQMTVNSLLYTMGTNDYLNVYAFNNVVYPLVSCFDNMLVQATPENLNLFKTAVFDLCPREKLKYIDAFKKAFDLFEKTDRSAASAKVIFLLTDILPPELVEIYNLYGTFYAKTEITVELFIYFIGIDVPNIREVQWDKCLRNGSIVHVRTMDEIKEDTLKYIPVIQRIQSDYVRYHPVTWTHVYIDIDKDKGMAKKRPPICAKSNATTAENKIYRFIVSASSPVYSTSGGENQFNGTKMLGIAGVDIDLIEFEKLTVPYKIGVNGYAFIVTNNGYLLFHPDIRRTQSSENFNTVDLTEVEFLDDDVEEPRMPHINIKNLRERMVNQESGEIKELAIKFHYDNMTRVGSETRTYVYAPLKCTPYTIGLSLPSKYGNHWIKTDNELIEQSRVEGDNYTNYFTGNWKVHPDWAYCNYIGLHQINFTSPEERLVHFLEKIFTEKSWQWKEPYPTTNNEDYFKNKNGKDNNCTWNVPESDHPEEYFCVKELLELLYFDAKLTKLYKDAFLKNDTEQEQFRNKLMEENNVYVRFLATQGGLTRWQDLYQDVRTEFGQHDNHALNEVWYKSAVLLQHLDSDSFVFSLPADRLNKSASEKLDEQLITASHAVFYEQGGEKAPGLVVGYQFTYKTLYDKLERIAKYKDLKCSLGALECYIIDSNGFVVASMDRAEVGKFFGSIEGAVMDKMISDKIFRQVSLFDYQGTCEEENVITSAAPGLLSSWFNNCLLISRWLISNFIWYLLILGSNLNSVLGDKNSTFPCNLGGSGYEDKCATREIKAHLDRTPFNENEKKTVSCDKKLNLYLFKNLSAGGYVSQKVVKTENCSRPVFVQRINYTNLLLVVVNAKYPSCYRKVSIDPEKLSYGISRACHRANVTATYKKKHLCGSRKEGTEYIKESCDKSDARLIFGSLPYLIYGILVIEIFY